MIRRIVTNNNVQTIFANENSDSVFIFKMDVEHVGDLTVPANSMLIFSGGTLTVNSGNFSQIMLVGGNYYYDNNDGTQLNNDPIVYEIITKKSNYDIILINRFNKSLNVLIHNDWYQYDIIDL